MRYPVARAATPDYVPCFAVSESISEHNAERLLRRSSSFHGPRGPVGLRVVLKVDHQDVNGVELLSGLGHDAHRPEHDDRPVRVLALALRVSALGDDRRTRPRVCGDHVELAAVVRHVEVEALCVGVVAVTERRGLGPSTLVSAIVA